MRIDVEKCEKMMKNIRNEELGQIYASQSQKPECFTPRNHLHLLHSHLPLLSLRQCSQTTRHLHHQHARSAIHAAPACLILTVHAFPDRRVEIEEGLGYIIKLVAFLEGNKL